MTMAEDNESLLRVRKLLTDTKLSDLRAKGQVVVILKDSATVDQALKVRLRADRVLTGCQH